MSTATEGHGGELAGLFCIAAAVVTGLGSYADLAGPVGRAADWLSGALLGLAKFLVPIVAAVVGVLLIRGRRAADDTGVVDTSGHARAVVGGLLVAVAGLGLLHLGRGAPRFDAGVGDISAAGGYLGALIGAPLRGLLGPVASVLVLVIVGLAGLLLITQLSLHVAAQRTAAGVKPVGGALRRAVESLFHIGKVDARPGGEHLDLTDDPTEVTELLPPGDAPTVGVFDQDVGFPAEAPSVGGPPSSGAGSAEPQQLEIALGPGAKRSSWKLPPAKLLHRTGSQQVDNALVTETGRNLERALAEHGVETRLIGMVVGPTVTRYELELGPGVKVAPGSPACTRTSPTTWPRPTCASWRPSPASRPSASRSPTAASSS